MASIQLLGNKAFSEHMQGFVNNAFTLRWKQNRKYCAGLLTALA